MERRGRKLGKSSRSVATDGHHEVRPFHVGILVADLKGAIKKFSEVLGIKFGPVQEMTMNARGSIEGRFKTKVAYSREGPMYLELIQGTQRDSLFSLKNGEGLHHIGVWSEDFSSYQGRAHKKKLPVTITMNIMPGDPTFWFSDPGNLHGTRVEFLNNGMRKGMEAWIQGEDIS